ncbi:MAG: hypothetical protein KA165_18640 [Saprospiraceae bacterium]|nr:hypothetical protein [Saprospiraceae bacterium]
MLKFCLLRLVPVFLISAISCTHVYFENPVPQEAKDLYAVPANLSGLYEYMDEQADDDPVKSLFKHCLRFEPINESQMLVSWDARLHERDFPALKQNLEEKKAAGEVIEYSLTENFIVCTSMVPANEGARRPQQQFVALSKEGPWYVVAQTRAPFFLFNFKSGIASNYSVTKSEGLDNVLPDADSLSVEDAQLVARSKDGAYYFNSKKAEDPGWSLISLRPQGSGGWLLKTSDVSSEKEFKESLAHFNKITPFEELSDSKYRVHPTDAELARLMSEPELFHSVVLRKLE